MTTATPVDRTSALFIAQSMLQEFEQELSTTRRFLERIPDDKLTWRPHEKSMTVGQLALHIAEVPEGVLDLSMHDAAAPPDLSVREQPASMKQVMERLDHTAAHLREMLPGLSDGRMQATFARAGWRNAHGYAASRVPAQHHAQSLVPSSRPARGLSAITGRRCAGVIRAERR